MTGVKGGRGTFRVCVSPDSQESEEDQWDKFPFDFNTSYWWPERHQHVVQHDVTGLEVRWQSEVNILQRREEDQKWQPPRLALCKYRI